MIAPVEWWLTLKLLPSIGILVEAMEYEPEYSESNVALVRKASENQLQNRLPTC
jgi:hypothetical protein